MPKKIPRMDHSKHNPGKPEGQRKRRDPEDRRVPEESEQEVKEKTLDKTIADSFPTSDPPSTIPDPSEDDNAAV